MSRVPLSLSRTTMESRTVHPYPVCSRRRPRYRSAGAAETWYVGHTRVTEPFFEHAAIARAGYLSFYRRVVEDLNAEAHLALEVLVKPNGRTSPAPFSLTRVDAILGGAEDPRPQRFAEALGPSHAEVFVLDSGLHVDQTSFSWEALRLHFTGEEFRIEILETWFRNWLDPDENREPDSSGLAGVVHDLAWSELEPNTWQLDIDLGSAPLEALSELLGILHDIGVTRVAVSRHDADDGDA